MANETVFRRYEGNPIVTPAAVPTANSIFNSAVVAHEGAYIGVFRVDTTSMGAGLHVGRSADGVNWTIEEDPIDYEGVLADWPEINVPNRFQYDPRITPLEGAFYVTWCHYPDGQAGGTAPAVGMARTTDFKTFELIDGNIVFMNRNGVLFPRKIGGQYALLHRPSDTGHTPFGDMYYATSPDLVHWGRHRFVIGPRGGWQSTKVGAGPVPIETDEGWLVIYHGVRASCSGFVYSAGAALLDLEQPWKVLYRTRPYLLAPTELYERVGDVPNVVFPCAAVVDDKNEVAMYYGCADTVLGVAYAQLEDIITFTKENSF
jgi:beta-1,4-mannooligosaccharide/beta-1,4-mannosyl-N-acetylglucosamine phosphorylase